MWGLSVASIVESLGCFGSSKRLGVAKHVDGDPRRDVGLGANTINALLHLPMPAVAAFHGIGGCRQQFVVQKGEGLLQVAERAANRPS